MRTVVPSSKENVDRMTKTTIITWNICLGNRCYLCLTEVSLFYWSLMSTGALCVSPDDNYTRTRQEEDEHEPIK